VGKRQVNFEGDAGIEKTGKNVNLQGGNLEGL
jgi:hypothetical protein